MPEESATPDLEEALRRSFEAVNRRDFDGALAIYSPDAVFDGSAIGGFVFEGREAIRGLFEDWVAAFEDYEGKLEELCDLGNGVNFAVLHQRGRLPGGSGVVELRYAAVGIWRDRLVERVTAYADVDHARAAAERLAAPMG